MRSTRIAPRGAQAGNLASGSQPTYLVLSQDLQEPSLQSKGGNPNLYILPIPRADYRSLGRSGGVQPPRQPHSREWGIGILQSRNLWGARGHPPLTGIRGHVQHLSPRRHRIPSRKAILPPQGVQMNLRVCVPVYPMPIHPLPLRNA